MMQPAQNGTTTIPGGTGSQAGPGPAWGPGTPIYANSVADACKQLPTSALGQIVLKALCGEAERSVAVEALAELLVRLQAADRSRPPGLVSEG
jgi:hypothetical protein